MESELREHPWRTNVEVQPDLVLSNERELVLIAGMNVIESESLAHEVAQVLVEHSAHHHSLQW